MSLNPARSFAPALYNWHWDDHWLYWVAPLSGSFVASILYKYVFGRDFSSLKFKEQEDSVVTVTSNNEVDEVKY